MKADPSLNIPVADSTSESWINWHKELKRVFGKKTANSLWLFAWAKRGGKNADANTSKTRTYMKSQGVNIDTSKWNEAFDSVKSSINQGLTVTKWVILGGLALGGIFLLFTLIRLIKNPNAQIPFVPSTPSTPSIPSTPSAPSTPKTA